MTSKSIAGPSRNAEMSHPLSTASQEPATKGSAAQSAKSVKVASPTISHSDIHLDLNIGPSSSLPSHHYAHMLAQHMETGGANPDLTRTMTAETSNALGPVTPMHEETDPLLLRSKVVNEQEIRRRVSGKGRKHEREVSKFYESQNSHIHNLLKPMSQHASEDAAERDSAALRVRRYAEHHHRPSR